MVSICDKFSLKIDELEPNVDVLPNEDE